MLQKSIYDQFLQTELKESVLITGQEGMGLLDGALYLARGYLLNSKDIPLEKNLDFCILEKKKTYTVEDAKQLVEMAKKRPLISDVRVIIVDGIEAFTVQAQNKLLKTLEDSKYLKVIGIAYSDTLLNTVKSRMLSLHIPNLTKKEFMEMYQEPDWELLYFLTNGCPLSIERVRCIVSICKECKELIIKGKEKSIFSLLHLVKEKDKEAFSDKYKELLPEFLNFLEAFYTEQYALIFFRGNEKQEKVERILKVILKQRQQVKNGSYTKDHFFYLIASLL